MSIRIPKLVCFDEYIQCCDELPQGGNECHFLFPLSTNGSSALLVGVGGHEVELSTEEEDSDAVVVKVPKAASHGFD